MHDGNQEIYEPQEDSYLLRQALIEHKDLLFGTALDMGTGSGILARTLAENPNITSVHACDINHLAIDSFSHETVQQHSKIVPHLSDLFTVFEQNAEQISFDTIVFNPPYLPDQEDEEPATKQIVSGGTQGHELTITFLEGLKRFLAPQGICFLIVSSLAPQDKINSYLFEQGFEYSIISEQSFFFETIFVYQIKHHQGLVSVHSHLDVPLDSFTYLTHGKKGIIFTFPYSGTTAVSKVYHFLHPSYPPERPYLAHEGTILTELNAYGVGPRIIWFSSDALVYRYCTGRSIGTLLETDLPGPEMRQTLGKLILLNCYLLDKIGISKFELTNPHKHIFIDYKESSERLSDPLIPDGLVVAETPLEIASIVQEYQKKNGITITFLDFERARRQDSPKNVTQIVQYFLYGKGSRLLSEGTVQKRARIKEILREYHQTYARESFHDLLTELF